MTNPSSDCFWLTHDYQCLWLGQSWSCLWFSCVLASDRPLLCFITVLMCFTDEVEDPYAERTCICKIRAASELRTKFRTSKTGFMHPPCHKVIFLLSVLMWFLCCSSSFCASVVSCMAFVLSLFDAHLSCSAS